MWNPFRREPDASMTITISGDGKPGDVGSVMMRHSTFVGMVQSCNVDIRPASSDPRVMLITGKKRNVEAFGRKFQLASSIGLV